MAVTHRIDITYRSSNGSVTIPQVSVIGDGELVFDGTIAAGATDFEIDLALDVSAMKGLAILTNGALTLETNNAGTPVDTVTFTSTNKGLIWYTGGPYANPFATDVTKIFATNAGASDVTLKIIVAADITPGG